MACVPFWVTMTGSTIGTICATEKTFMISERIPATRQIFSTFFSGGLRLKQKDVITKISTAEIAIQIRCPVENMSEDPLSNA